MNVRGTLAARYEAERAAVDGEIAAAYWRFTRCSRSAPPARALYRRRELLDARLRALRCSRRSPVRLLLGVVRAAAEMRRATS